MAVGYVLGVHHAHNPEALAKQWDCSRTTASRLLEQAGVQAYYFGRGRTGSKRYLKNDIDCFLVRVEKA